MSTVRPMETPRCYFCNRLFRKGDAMVIVAVGPGQKREQFRKAEPNDAADTVYVGAECAKRYVPLESIIDDTRRR